VTCTNARVEVLERRSGIFWIIVINVRFGNNKCVTNMHIKVIFPAMSNLCIRFCTFGHLAHSLRLLATIFEVKDGQESNRVSVNGSDPD
jgi:hypothetical protein